MTDINTAILDSLYNENLVCSMSFHQSLGDRVIRNNTTIATVTSIPAKEQNINITQRLKEAFITKRYNPYSRGFSSVDQGGNISEFTSEIEQRSKEAIEVRNPQELEKYLEQMEIMTEYATRESENLISQEKSLIQSRKYFIQLSISSSSVFKRENHLLMRRN